MHHALAFLKGRGQECCRFMIGARMKFISHRNPSLASGGFGEPDAKALPRISSEPLEHTVVESGKAQKAPRHIKPKVRQSWAVAVLVPAFIGLAISYLTARE